MNFERRKEHQRNEKLEELLREVNSLLAPVEREVARGFSRPANPVILIMGAPRSGSTLFLQWLASLGCFCYPTNLLSRFYQAPYLGAKIQLMLTKHDFNAEIFDFNPEVPFTSRLGKTKGALAPNEFWYFWRRFFHFGEIQKLNDDALAAVDADHFLAELSAIEGAFGLPLALKGMFLNWNIPFLDLIMEKALFVHIRRHPVYSMQSLLKARVDYFGSRDAWYSLKPPEYTHLAGCSPVEQVAGQVFYTNRAVEEGLAQVAEPRQMVVNYEEFCRDPRSVYLQIRERLYSQGTVIEEAYRGPLAFEVANKLTLSQEETEQASDAWARFSGTRITP